MLEEERDAAVVGVGAGSDVLVVFVGRCCWGEDGGVVQIAEDAARRSGAGVVAGCEEVFWHLWSLVRGRCMRGDLGVEVVDDVLLAQGRGGSGFFCRSCCRVGRSRGFLTRGVRERLGEAVGLCHL